MSSPPGPLSGEKLYWRLREPEFKGALLEAQNLRMNVTGHIDLKVMTIDRALDLGLRNFEHIHTLAYSVMTAAGFDSLMARKCRPRSASGRRLSRRPRCT